MTEVSTPEKSKRSRWVVMVAVALTVAIILAGFWFATQFQSSAQREADAKAPAAGPVVAEVTQGTLAGEVSFTGQAGPLTQTLVSVLAAEGASLSVVTGRPLKAGETASSGQLLTEVNGRPLFGVLSAFSFYRDMGVGDRGPDVEALQNALAARSYGVTADGLFGKETAAAVKRWYDDSGYVPPTRDSASAEDANVAEREESKGTEAQAPAQEVYVPVPELVAIPAKSAQVIQGVQIGQRVAGGEQADFILGSADIVIAITVPVTALGGVEAGDTATIAIEGVAVEGTVGDIRSTDATDAAGSSDSQDGDGQSTSDGADGASEVTFTVTPTAALTVKSGRARVTVVKEVIAQDALIVPVLAVSDRGPDQNVVTKQAPDGTFVEVPVTVLGTLQGEVAVEPAKPGALEPGDQVRVG